MKLTELSKIFHVQYGGSFSKVSNYESGATPVIKSRATHNGVIEFLDIEPNFSHVISVARTGSVGASFFHGYPCFVTDDCMVLTPKSNLSEHEMLIYSKFIKANSFKYNYSRKVTPGRIKKETLPLPSQIKAMASKLLIPPSPPTTPANENGPLIDLAKHPHRHFRLDSIFDIRKGKRITKANLNEGTTPFIGAIDSNNGYRQYVDVKPNHPKNTITVNYNGNGVADAYYQPEPFWASDDVNVLYPKFSLNSHRAMFVCAIIRMEKFRFSYGRKWHLERMNASTIRLPVRDSNEPDWDLIERYIMSLPFSESI